MKTAFIIHGTSDTPESNWFPWLKGELEKRNYEVIVPQFPPVETESFESWYEVFKEYEEKITNETLFIGHSLGTCFIMKYLSLYPQDIKGIYLVGAWGEMFSDFLIRSQHSTFEKVCFSIPIEWMYNYESFVEGIDFEKVKVSSQKRVIINSGNDPYIPLELGENLKNNLEAELVVYSHAGHFCKRDGYTEFWDLLDKIEG